MKNMTDKLTVSIVGGSGYSGGELIRLLLRHPYVELRQVTSNRYTGLPVHTIHPNLRKATDLKFVGREDVEPCDLLFTAVPHGSAMKAMKDYMKKGKKIVDISSDFRLHNKADYPIWYGHEHECPELLEKFTYGIPELHREQIRKATYVSGPGCLASSVILGLYPLFKNGIVETERVVVDGLIGSSATGDEPSLASHHPERSRAVRAYAMTMHRHTAEMEQELDFGAKPNVLFSAIAIELVRGIMSTCHLELKKPMENKEIWAVYRKEYENEPFIRIVKEKKGIWRYPDPKILVGSNYCDIGFEIDTHQPGKRLVVMSAIDNMMKGAGGVAVQCMNLMYGFEETTGLEALGLHPV